MKMIEKVGKDSKLDQDQSNILSQINRGMIIEEIEKLILNLKSRIS